MKVQKFDYESKKKRARPRTLFDRIKQELETVQGDLEANDEGKWLNLQRGLVNLSIEFDDKGNHISRIVMCEDIMQIVDQKRIF